jgi:hypothetical protein
LIASHDGIARAATVAAASGACTLDWEVDLGRGPIFGGMVCAGAECGKGGGGQSGSLLAVAVTVTGAVCGMDAATGMLRWRATCDR